MEPRTLHQTLETLAQQACDICSVNFWGMELSTGAKQSFLRIFIDTEEGVGLDQCENVSRQISDLLDVHDPFDAPYRLEISSPGMNRRLFKPEHFKKYTDHPLIIQLREAILGRKKFHAHLLEATEEHILVRTEEGEETFFYDAIAKATLEA